MSRMAAGFRARRFSLSSIRVCGGWQTDYVDLYQIHRWDYETPIEETLEALHDVVKAGKVRYIGASSMYAWQFAKALYLAELHGWTRFVSMQNHYNLLYREEEREMMGLCAGGRDRRDSVEPAGARTADAAVAGGERRSALRRIASATRCIRAPRRTTGKLSTGWARLPRSADVPRATGGAGVDAEQAGDYGADRGRDETASS